MKEKIVHIPELHNNNYSFMQAFSMICEENINNNFAFTDISKSIKQELKGRKLNIVAGGSPCQGFSMAGKRDTNDPRNKLYLEVLDIVKTLNPEFIFLENVKGLLSMDGGKVKKRILEDFQNIGYDIQAHLLNSAEFNTPQKRKELYLLAIELVKRFYTHKV